MTMENTKSPRGFSLLELMVATSLGIVVLLAMTSLFKVGMSSTFTITQRLEVQENMRAAMEMMAEDISQAGGGLPTGGLQLVTGGTVSKIAVNQAGTTYVPADLYPASGAAVPNYMYGIVPGFNNGVQNATAITAAPGLTNDSMTSIYVDNTFQLSNFTFTITSGTSVTVGVIAVPNTTLPTNILAPGGFSANGGDVLLFLVNTAGNGTTSTGTSLIQDAAVAAEVTAVAGTAGTTNCAASPGSCTWTLTLATNDALNMNQTGGTTNNLSTVSAAIGGAGAHLTVSRLDVVTYFLQVPPTGAGNTVQTPRLMRQVSGQTAVPVADNIINLQFTYDVINNVNGTITANLADPLGAGQSPSLIQKVNIVIMGQSMTSDGNKSQSMYLVSSVAASDMSFCNTYSASTTSCQ